MESKIISNSCTYMHGTQINEENRSLTAEKEMK